MTPSIAGAIVGLSSWAGDIGERLLRGQITEEQALAELAQRQAEAQQEIAAARAAVAADRAKIDAEVAKLPRDTPPAAGAAAP